MTLKSACYFIGGDHNHKGGDQSPPFIFLFKGTLKSACYFLTTKEEIVLIIIHTVQTLRISYNPSFLIPTRGQDKLVWQLLAVGAQTILLDIY